MAIIKAPYWRHRCRVKGQVYSSIQEAARSTGLGYTYIYLALRQGRRGFAMLPYDGILPAQRNTYRQPPHVHVEGCWYYSQQEAATDLGVAKSTVRARILSKDYPDYYVHLLD